MDLKCSCQHCNGHIVIDDSDAGRTAPCPHCNLETVLYALQTTPPASNPPIRSSGYISKNLMVGESVAATAKLHWAIYLKIIPVVLIFPFLCAIQFVTAHSNSTKNSFLILLIASTLTMVVMIGLPMALIAYLKVRSSEFAVTNKRVLMKTGLIRRNSVEILLTKIESIKVNQGFIGRILDYGTVIVCGTGGTKDPFHLIASPLKFRQKIQIEIEKTVNP